MLFDCVVVSVDHCYASSQPTIRTRIRDNLYPSGGATFVKCSYILFKPAVCDSTNVYSVVNNIMLELVNFIAD